MADGPIDYAGAFANVPTPTQALGQGFQSGSAMQQTTMQQTMQRMQIARMQAMQGAAAQLAQDPTPENIARFSMAFPEMSEQAKRSYDMLQPVQQRAQLQHMTEVYAAAQNGRPDVSAKLLRDRADALAATHPDDPQVQNMRTMADWVEQHPDSFKASSGAVLASLMGPDKFGDTFKSLTESQKTQALLPADVQKAKAEADIKTAEAGVAPERSAVDVENVRSQIENRAGQLQLDRDKLTTEAQLKLQELKLQYGMPPDDARKTINESAVDAAAGEQSAARLEDMASRMQRVSDENRAGGAMSSAAEAARAAFGYQDGVTALKQEYARIVNNQALASIKDALGGRVTDVDMKTAMSTVPSPNASTELVTSYLRGVAKLQRLAAAQKEAQAEWLAQVGRAGHLGPAPHDLTIMGTSVPAGTTFADFSRQLIQDKAQQIQAQQSLVKAQGRSYMRWATPDASGAAPESSGPGGGATGSW